MKYLNWFADNINRLSFIAGIVAVAYGKAELGQILIKGVGV